MVGYGGARKVCIGMVPTIERTTPDGKVATSTPSTSSVMRGTILASETKEFRFLTRNVATAHNSAVSMACLYSTADGFSVGDADFSVGDADDDDDDEEAASDGRS